jgi:Protein of unknown function (DUF1656)
MIAEFDIYGVFVPALLAFAIVAFLLVLVVTRLLNAIGFYRFVWHRPLFDIALGVILFGAVVAFAEPVVGFLRHHVPWMMA